MKHWKRGLVGLGAASIVAASLVGSGAALAQDDELIVGVSWNNYNEERWARADEPAIVSALTEMGARYISTNAKSSASQQADDIDLLLTLGVDALIILAQDQTAILPAVQAALDQGVPVVAYDRLIEDPRVLYLTFDNTEVGRQQARVIYDLMPKGRYAMIKGNEADPNARVFLYNGYMEVIGPAVEAGDIEIVCETFTDNWETARAQANMEQCLTATSNGVDAVLSQNDGMATGIVKALEAQGMAGIPLSGQDGDIAALNRVALGTQSVSVWKDAFSLGRTAGQAAVQLANGAGVSEIVAPSDLPEYAAPAAGATAVLFTTPDGNEVSSITLTPLPVTQENLQVPIDAGWVKQEQVCLNVTAGSVAACP